jgi:alanyl-tRNA synthetase
MHITAHELRSRYLEFFVAKGHAVIPSASLVPANDPTVLFTTAGMHPLGAYLLGEPHPAGARLTDVQKCVRTGDIDAIGDGTHLTFFEMLGNWSLGDYGRDEAIAWSFEFLVDRLGVPLDRLGVTCFAGDADVPEDVASQRRWRSLGIERIAQLGRDDNWWGPAGETGPCGPDTEIFYWTGAEPPCGFDVTDRRWVEIWNNVFMEYERTASGAIVALPRRSVDTGMGVERTLVALNELASVYEVDTMRPIVGELRAPGIAERELRIVSDHVRAACALIADGVLPSNKDRGYVLRRLLRRAMVYARRLPSDWYVRAVTRVAATLGDAYPELTRPSIADVIASEVTRFEAALARGIRELERRPVLDGKVAFDLFQTHGIPFEIARELASATGVRIDDAAFRDELERHRDRSRTQTGMFAGGLADHSVEIVRYHTLTHLLQAALRAVLGDHVLQRGSNITRERLRFDFSHGGKLTPDELARVEQLVNGWLGRDFVVERATMSQVEAHALGAIGAFGENYGDTVSVYTIHDGTAVISREFCGGPHAGGSRELAGTFRIVREEPVAAGIRRIKAVLDPPRA